MAGTAVGRARSQRAGCSNARPKSRAIALEVRILDRLACLPRRGGGGARRTADGGIHSPSGGDDCDTI